MNNIITHSFQQLNNIYNLKKKKNIKIHFSVNQLI